jgi:hypothetical protein
MTKETISGHGSMGYSSISEQRSQYSTIENRMGATTTEMVIGSVQHLEYSISDALNKVTTVKQKQLQ